MPQNLDKARKFLRELQRSDKTRKKRWLIAFTAFSMIVVLALWLVYINVLGIPSTVVKTPAPKAENSLESVWGTFKRGLSEIFSNVKSQLETSKNLIENQFQKTNEVIINVTSTATSSEPNQQP